MDQPRHEDGCAVLVSRYLVLDDALPLPGAEILSPEEPAQPKPMATLESSNSPQMKYT